MLKLRVSRPPGGPARAPAQLKRPALLNGPAYRWLASYLAVVALFVGFALGSAHAVPRAAIASETPVTATGKLERPLLTIAARRTSSERRQGKRRSVRSQSRRSTRRSRARSTRRGAARRARQRRAQRRSRALRRTRVAERRRAARRARSNRRATQRRLAKRRVGRSTARARARARSRRATLRRSRLRRSRTERRRRARVASLRRASARRAKQQRARPKSNRRTKRSPKASSGRRGGVIWAASASCLAGNLRAIVYRLAKRVGKVRVNSTCRSRARNRRVGGASRSWHLTGNAMDLRVFGNIGLAAQILRSAAGGYKHYGGGLFHIDNGPRRTW
ncbi:MAG: D-Ala-D-Ala carboxypeptidase family metallohydrolase [Pseudomonadota bacterium]